MLKALGPDGILINMARGSVVDEAALIKALADKTIMTAGLDVYQREPEVPAELLAMDHVVLFPHLGSATVYTRGRMDQLVVDNLLAMGGGQTFVDAGARDTLAATEAGVIISRDDPALIAFLATCLNRADGNLVTRKAFWASAAVALG